MLPLNASVPGSNGNDGVLHLPPNSSITGTSLSDCLVSYPGHSLGWSYPSAERQKVYFTAPANWAIMNKSAGKRYLVLRKSIIHIFIYASILHCRIKTIQNFRDLKNLLFIIKTTDNLNLFVFHNN